MTVLVYGDRSVSSVGNLQEGETFESYFNSTPNERGIYYPDPHLSKSSVSQVLMCLYVLVLY